MVGTDTGIIIEVHESDIRRFLEHEIGGPNDLEPEAMDETLRKLIIDKVADSAKGMLVQNTSQTLELIITTIP